MLGGQLFVQGLPLMLGGRGQFLLVQDSHRGLRAHHGDLGVRPGEHLRRTEGSGVHRDVGPAVDLSGHQRHPRYRAFAEGVQKFRAAAHHTAPLLVHPGQVARHVDDHHQGDAERVAQSHEPGRLLGALGVQAAAEAQRIVGQHAHGAPGQPAQADHHGRGPLGLELLERAVGVQQCLDQRMNVVGPARRLGQQGMQVDVTGLGLGAVEMALLAEVSDQAAAAGVGVEFVGRDDVTHPGLAVVGVGPAEGLHVDVLTGDAAHHVGPGDEHPSLRSHDHDVGEGGAVGGAAGGESDDHRNLRDMPGGADHRLEDQAHGMQCPNTLGQAGSTGVPDADDRGVLLDGQVVGVDDVLTAFYAHRPAHHRAVGAERDGAQTVDGAGGGEHAGTITLVQQFDAVVVEEGAQPQQGVAGVEGLADRFRSHDRHSSSSWSDFSSVRLL